MLTLKVITQETEKVLKGLEKKIRRSHSLLAARVDSHLPKQKRSVKWAFFPSVWVSVFCAPKLPQALLWLASCMPLKWLKSLKNISQSGGFYQNPPSFCTFFFT